MPYSLNEYVRDLKRITAATDDCDAIFDQIAPLASKLALAKEGWLKPEHYEYDEEQGFGAHLLFEEPDHSLAVFAFSWGPNRGTPPHDHGTWAIVAGVDGEERNIKYNRMDDGTKAGHAKLVERCEFTAKAGETVCLKPAGIHLVWNDNDFVTVSLHTYGKHVNYTGRSSFDTKTDEMKPFVVKMK